MRERRDNSNLMMQDVKWVLRQAMCQPCEQHRRSNRIFEPMERATTSDAGSFYLTLDPKTLAPFPSKSIAAKFLEGAPPLSPLESFIIRTAVNSAYVLQIEVMVSCPRQPPATNKLFN